MKTYKNKITLSKNGRGIWCLDTTAGCRSGLEINPRGCYGDCYAARAAKIYGFDFSTTVVKDWESEKSKAQIIRRISKIDMPFVRIGCSGDPSEAWERTIQICKDISVAGKEIVIITRHWGLLTNRQLEEIKPLNLCINTSVSALDADSELGISLSQYARLKPFCKSVLRIISCDFNVENERGAGLKKIQDQLFENENTIDTVFRPTKKNPLVVEGVVNVVKTKFLGTNTLASKRNQRTYFGKCDTCVEKCGVGELKTLQSA